MTQQPEAYPTEVSYIGEIQESDGLWGYLVADRDRTVVEKRIARHQERFPAWADGSPIRTRIIRTTKTYTEIEASGRRCICGDPVQWMDHPDGSGWIHSPGSETTCLDARPTPAP
ncbi:hypothetical protein [Streptomyces sp. NPDC002908]|uniref:hypothetical protein n=1 Tax=Streptomyces sp. NPDC002908 TaxID=3364670 RepID=UPI0036C1B7BC